MKTITKKLVVLCLILCTVSCFAQQEITINRLEKALQERWAIDLDGDREFKHTLTKLEPLICLDRYELLSYSTIDSGDLYNSHGFAGITSPNLLYINKMGVPNA